VKRLAAGMLATAVVVAAAAQPSAPLAPCGGVAAAAAATHPDAVDALLRAEPERALAVACAALPRASPVQAAWLQVQVADALLTLSRRPEAKAVLAPLETAARARGESADGEAWRGVWFATAGRAAFDETDYAGAAAHFAAARERLQRAGRAQTRAYAQVLLGQAQTLRVERRLAEAERAAAEAETLLAALGLARSLDMGDALNARGMLAHARQDLPETARLARAEIDLLRELGHGDDPETLHSYATLGAVLSQLARFAEAEAALREGEAVIARHPDADPSGQVGVFTNLAMLYLDQGRHEAAREPSERAMTRAAALYGADSPRLITPLMARGQVHLRGGRYAAAQADLQRALAIADANRASVGMLRKLRLRDALAVLQIQLGDLAAASQLVEAGLAEAGTSPDLGYWRGRLLRRQALLATRAGRFADADRQLAEAAELIGAVIGREHGMVAELVAERCSAQLQQGGAAPACDALRERLPALQSGAPTYRFRAHAALAQQALRDGDAAAALDHHLQALAAAETDGAADPRWPALDALAQHLRSSGRNALAVFVGKSALAAIEDLRREANAVLHAADRSFLVDKVAVYRRVAEWQAEDGRIAEALQTVQLLKEEEFLEFVQRRGDLLGAPGAAALTEAERRIAERWPRPAAARGDGVAEREAEWAARARIALGELVDVDTAQPRGPPPVPAAGGARDGELVVHTLSGATHLTLFLESRQGVESRRLAWGSAAAGREVGALLAALGRGDAAVGALQALYQRLGAPIDEAAQAAGVRRIVLDLDGPLRYLPLAALHDGRGPLGARYTFVSRPRAGDADTPRQTARPSLMAVGVSRPLPGQPALPGVAREVCAIVAGPVHGLDVDDPRCAPGGGVVPGIGWLNEAFTQRRLLDAAARGGGGGALLHVGTHFDLRPGHMGRSSLLLGDGTRMTLDQVAQLSFEGHDLVTLSACETGLGGAGADGREVEGLNLLMLRRGARAVLASLWRVDDRSTSQLMRAFYRELARTDAAEALRRAQAEVRASAGWQAPYHWAGFYVTSR
jgi:tetratricopeptide (TPR) repeat protein